MKSPLLLTSFLLLSTLFCMTSCLKENPDGSFNSPNGLLSNPKTTEDIKPDKHYLTVRSTYDKTQDETFVSLQVRPFNEDGFPLEVVGDDYYAVNGTVLESPAALWFAHRITLDGPTAITNVLYRTHDSDHVFTYDPLPDVTITSQHNSLSITQGDTVFFNADPLQQDEELALYLRQSTPLDTVSVWFEQESPADNFIVLDWQRLTSAPFVEGSAELRLTRQRNRSLNHPTLAGIRFYQSARDRVPVVLTW